MALTLLITGTDTEVGKTFVGVGLISAWLRMGFRVAPFKPVETGCVMDPAAGGLIPADARLLEAAAGTSTRLEIICPYQFSMPVAPWVAAEKEQRAIDVDVLDRCLHELQSTHDIVLIETAGGLLVPLSQTISFADLTQRWNVPVLVVAGSRLGVLNQTLLTIRYIEKAGLKIAGCVLNHPYGDGKATSLGAVHKPALDTNGTILRKLISCPVWEVPFATGSASGQSDAIFGGIAEAIVAKFKQH